jgi:formylglycine-generating enzyme required for sulfatase activity
MAGNVWEWTVGDNALNRPARGGAWNNPLGDASAFSSRNKNEPGERDVLIGMRCAQ